MTINAPSQQMIFLIPQGCETLRPTHDKPRISERIGKLRQYRSQGESIALCKKVDIFHGLGSHPLQIRRYNPITYNFLTKQTGWQETNNREKKWAWFHRRNSTASTVKMIGQPRGLRESTGVTDGTRTHDDRNHNPGLYQLSYGHH
jgi:hypothetical protein